MPPIKVMVVFGTRPEAIKMAPIVQSLRKNPAEFSTTVVVTAQHREMLDQVMALFKIKADHDLDVMQKSQTLDYVVARIITELGPLLDSEKPDLVLVHGDTVTTFAASLVAFYHKIPVGHVEAGLRSFDKENPFPEESNRVLTDALCTLYFAPTADARKNLLDERVAPERIFVTGNTVIDALKIALETPHTWNSPELNGLFAKDALVQKPGSRLLLLTAHRRENHGEPLENIFRALRRIIDQYPGVYLLYPVHLNPAVQKAADKILRGHPSIHLIPPVDYHDMVNLLKRAYLIVTDSGGIQEEAPTLGKPVLVLRKVTERPEGVRAGTTRVIGVEEEPVYETVKTLLTDAGAYAKMSTAANPYGDGNAALRILDAIRYHFGARKNRPDEF